MISRFLLLCYTPRIFSLHTLVLIKVMQYVPVILSLCVHVHFYNDSVILMKPKIVFFSSQPYLTT